MSPRNAVLVMASVVGAAFVGCIDRPVEPVNSVTQSGIVLEVPNEGIDTVDLLVMVDNSGSMRENQQNIMSQFRTMIQTLTQPPCVSDANPAPHTCVASDPGDRPKYPAVSNMHVGVVSSDLGTPGSNVPGCMNGDLGDDGMLNPIRNGGALAHHEPWVTAPPTFGRPTDCQDPNQFPSFISFTSGATDATTFTHDFQCNAGLYVGGCGLEAQLESVYRALVIHDATDHPGNTSPNAGFLRENALLAIVMLTDEEDGSVRDCRFANGTPCEGQGGIDVYNPASTAWSASELNLRFYMYQPCGPQDPTWPVARYVDPASPTTGLLSLKPGHPERIVFAAIAGVPLDVPSIGSGMSRRIDWNGLLGTPGAGGADDFCGRDSSTLASLASAEGPVSMMAANADPNCAQRTVPACRRQGTAYSPTACTTDVQYFAWPSRRVVEVARRFDQDPLCNGAPCNNGLVTSVCSGEYATAMSQIVDKIQSNLIGQCLPRRLSPTFGLDGRTVTCVIRVTMPEGTDACDTASGLHDPVTNGTANPMHVTLTGGSVRRICEVDQVATDVATHAPVSGSGWYYDDRPQTGAAASCTQRISFTGDATPPRGSVTHLECIQGVTGLQDAGTE